jgi:uncharacterized MAPEG superfamily protein
MFIELTILILSVMLGVFQIVIAITAATLQRGLNWNTGDRSGPVPPLTGVAGRLDRALQNFKETFPLFAVALLAVVISGRDSDLSRYGAAAYLTARVIYIPLYALGIPYLRSLAWLMSMVGILMVLLSFTR